MSYQGAPVRRGNGTKGLVIVSGLLLLLAVAASSLLFNALRGFTASSEYNGPAERFAPIHRPFVPPPPDQDAPPKQGSMLQIQYVNWQNT